MALLGLATLITNLVIYQNNDSYTKQVLITIVINSIANTATSGVQQGISPGYLIIPTGAFIMISVVPFLFGRCLTISATVNFTRKLTTALLVVGVFFPINSVIAFVLDSVYFSKANNPGLAIFILILVHGTIALSFVFMILVTYKCSVEVSKQTLIFHDFLINYNTTPKGSRMNQRHVAPMEEIKEEESHLEQS